MLRRFVFVFLTAMLALPGQAFASHYILKRERTLAAFSTQTSQRTAAVILFNFAGDERRPYTPDQVRRIVFTGDKSVNSYLSESSFGRAGLTGDVFGWFTIPERHDECRFAEWARAAQAAAEESGVDLAAYQHKVLVFPHLPSCNWPGLAELPGALSWINGELSVRIVSHELGHNLGAHHASALRCVDGTVPVAVGPTCSAAEYGDPFDVMGIGERHTSNWNKARLGWLADSNRATVTANGTFTLAAQEALSPDLQLLRIPRGDGLFYYLELRRPFGSFFDNFSLADPAVRGVTLRLAPDYANTLQSQLIDTRPSTSTFDDAPLTVGRTFVDRRHGIWIVNQGIIGGRATVEVSIGAPPDAKSTSTPKRTPRPRRAPLGGRRLHGVGRQEPVRGGPGNDVLFARNGRRDVVRCGRGRDVVTADPRDAVARDCEIVSFR